MNIDERYGLICYEIEDCLRHNKKSFYIYPFGVNGLLIKQILNNRYGIHEKGVIDNKLATINNNILRISDLKEEDITSDGIILISTEEENTLKSIVKNLPSFLKSHQISFCFNQIWENSLTDYMDFDIFYKHCKIGKRTSNFKYLLNPACLVETIGRYCSINPSAKVVPNHSLDTISTDNFLLELNKTNWESEEDYKKRVERINKYGRHRDNCWNFFTWKISNNPPIKIGNDVWIGQNVVILPGVIVHDGAVLAAGAVVTHDVPPYTIVGGVPAKTIKKRYSDETINKLLQIRWWDWSDEKIKENIELFYQPDKFIKEFYTNI